MSLYGALFSGVSGLQAQSNKISVLSDNIANVNTVGYKSGQGLFESLVTSTGGGQGQGGVIGTARSLVDQQGLLQSTSSPTDIAISGSGFFIVNQTFDGTGQLLYTRAGNFTQNATGNFRNAAGFFLQAWPLDRNGLLPGAPGNLNTTSSANLSSLQTVNVQNLTGTATATSNVSIGANLNSAQLAFGGAAGLADMDAQDTANSSNGADTIIVPTAIDSLTVGDEFTIATGGGLTYTYTYGGFGKSRNVTSGLNGDLAGGALTAGTTTLVNPPFAVTTVGASSTTITVAHTGHTVAIGDTVTFSGNTENINGIPAATFNGNFIVSSVPDANHYTITVPAVAASRAVTFTTDGGSTDIIVNDPASNLTVGDVVTISGVGGAGVGGIAAANINGVHTVTAVDDAGHYHITAGAGDISNAVVTAGGAGSALTTTAGHGTIVEDTRMFTGQILNANLPTDTFLGSLAATNFTAAALTFTISTSSSGTATFTYTASAPNTQLGQFNNLNTLADAISNSTGLTARVFQNQLYVSAIDASDGLSFANGSIAGTDGPPLQSGINWVGELGLQNFGNVSNRYTTLQGLANLVNASSGLSASIENPLSDSILSMSVENPLDTINFIDGDYGSPNIGSPLSALGLLASLNSVVPTPSTIGATTSAIGPSYDPADATKNMASGTITPQFSRPVQIFDALGTGHNLNIGFIKTGVNQWAAEIYPQPATDVTTAADQPLAFGTITFNGDGTLRDINGTLPTEVAISWSNGAAASAVTFDWGTAGQPFGTPNATAIGKTDGLGQFNTDYHVNFVNQNGAPVGQLTGVSIDEEGFVSASYSNGETQKLYKIPLAKFADPNNLQAISGNVFAQTEASGQVNLSQAGSGGAGNITSSSLEASNVELADQLTDMIVAQRAYQANTKVISTTDQLLSDLNNILR